MHSIVMPFVVAAGTFCLLLAGMLLAVREGRLDSPAARGRALTCILFLAALSGVGAALIE